MRLIVRKSQLLRAVLSCASRKNVVLSGSRIKLLAGTNTDQSIPGDNAPSGPAHNGTYGRLLGAEGVACAPGQWLEGEERYVVATPRRVWVLCVVRCRAKGSRGLPQARAFGWFLRSG